MQLEDLVHLQPWLAGDGHRDTPGTRAIPAQRVTVGVGSQGEDRQDPRSWTQDSRHSDTPALEKLRHRESCRCPEGLSN